MSELSWILGHPARFRELLVGVGKPPHTLWKGPGTPFQIYTEVFRVVKVKYLSLEGKKKNTHKTKMQIEETKTFKCTTTSSNQFIESSDYIVYSYLGVMTFSDQT